jgi:hypothetical protein
VIVTDGARTGSTVIVIPDETAEGAVIQDALDVMMQVTTSPLTSEEEMYVVPPVPTLDPFTCHWYVGVAPPLTGTAVNVTELPAQTVLPGLADTLTAGVTIGFTVMVIPAEVAVVGLAQGELEVKVHVTISPFARPDVVYVVPVAPTVLPLTSH